MREVLAVFQFVLTGNTPPLDDDKSGNTFEEITQLWSDMFNNEEPSATHNTKRKKPE
jgi:hypothetical protein